MIKRIIFDVDNTLIMWKDYYRNAIKETLEKYNKKIDYLEVDSVIEEYEKFYDKYSEENMVELLNNKLKLDIGLEFVNDWLFKLANITEYSEDTYETIKYLYDKYELVILSNWFKGNQSDRLKKAKIYKYFKEIYCGEEHIKPQKSAYIEACGNNLPEECLMVGDNYKIDIEGGINAGLDVIMITSKDDNKDNIKTIRNIKELKNIL